MARTTTLQWCARSSPTDERTPHIDEEAPTVRMYQVQAFIHYSGSAVRRYSSTVQIDKDIPGIELFTKDSDGTTLERYRISLNAGYMREAF